MKQPIVLISVGLQIYDVWEIQNFVQKILEKVILTLSAKTGRDYKPLITVAKKAHYITGAIGVVDALEDHLILCNIRRVLYGLGKYEHAFTLKLFQCFIGDLVRQIFDMSEGILFLL